MRAWTNLAWPDDPYRTGQQLYRKPAGRLAAFTTLRGVPRGQQVPVTAAIVYLPLHCGRPVTVTGHTLTFGFRAASTSDPAEVPAVAAVADLDLMQARRHAAVLAGYLLADDLARLGQDSGVPLSRGLAAVTDDWTRRGPAASRAALFDCGLDLPGSPPLERACQQAGLSPVPAEAACQESRDPAVLAVERALAIALLCARHHGRYDWSGTLDIPAAMTASTWDCLPWTGTAPPAEPARYATVAPGGTDAAPTPGPRT